jgi:UDP-N-acetylmuramate dehydrogenase
MDFEHDVPLAPRTTLGLGGPARRFAKVTNEDELREALASATAAHEPVLVLGGGSNLVIGDAGFAGLVIQVAMTQRTQTMFDYHSEQFTEFGVGAGVVWDDFVQEMVSSGHAGVECMSGIPGLVGATPMQNVGAYGQEVSDTIIDVRAFDRQTGEIVTMSPEDCVFGYRTSVFRGSDRWIILEVGFRLRRFPYELSSHIMYPELAKALGVAENERVPLAEVRRVVLELRRGKGMVVDPDDPESRSAGSFFTNPLVDEDQLAALAARLPGVTFPQYLQVDGRTKLAAAWLIERAGFKKGFTLGRVGISKKHALALVNRGGATTRELLDFAASIQQGVRDRLGIELQLEPIVVGD